MIKQENSNRRFKRAFKGCSQEIIDISSPPAKKSTARSSMEVATSSQQPSVHVPSQQNGQSELERSLEALLEQAPAFSQFEANMQCEDNVTPVARDIGSD